MTLCLYPRTTLYPSADLYPYCIIAIIANEFILTIETYLADLIVDSSTINLQVDGHTI